MFYNQQLTAYARRSLKELYAFAAQNEHCSNSDNLKKQVAELLAFASDDQLNEIAKRLTHQKDPSKFILEEHGAWQRSQHNPAAALFRKSAPKTVSRITTRRKFFS
ncbi:hypothetical protein UFOVP1451_28 [uncultured Caudovirales phage]|uniref:Uncharacterized protein n=1 Tax=uncultured Caudovirales phage TaxID=2100421 RepID=A0A6J5SGU5_9CAUD|nr:hypothetical protein UFOVP1451_28 [uncultured Caudovirales phage]